MAREIWECCLGLFDIQWVFPRKVLQVVESWRCTSSNKSTQVIWKLVRHAIFWSLWIERNKRTFENTENSVQAVKLKVLNCPFACGEPDNFCNRTPLNEFLLSLQF